MTNRVKLAVTGALVVGLPVTVLLILLWKVGRPGHDMERQLTEARMQALMAALDRYAMAHAGELPTTHDGCGPSCPSSRARRRPWTPGASGGAPCPGTAGGSPSSTSPRGARRRALRAERPGCGRRARWGGRGRGRRELGPGPGGLRARPSTHRGGLTLIEIVVAIAVMALIAAVTLPAMGGLFDLQQRGAVKELGITYTWLLDEAALRNATFRMVFDLDRGTWKVEVGDPDTVVFSTPEEAARSTTGARGQDGPLHPAGARGGRGRGARGRPLPLPRASPTLLRDGPAPAPGNPLRLGLDPPVRRRGRHPQRRGPRRPGAGRGRRGGPREPGLQLHLQRRHRGAHRHPASWTSTTRTTAGPWWWSPSPAGCASSPNSSTPRTPSTGSPTRAEHPVMIPTRQHQRAFTLLEVVIGLGILALGLMVLVETQSISVLSTWRRTA